MKNFLILSTASSKEEAETIAENLVTKKLAACCNIVPAVTSIYNWDDKLQKYQETLIFIKTTEERTEEVVSIIKQYHSYQVPEIIALEIITGSEEYLRWLQTSVKR